MIVGSVLGVLFVSLIRRVMVEDPELPFPESVAASEIHKAGQKGAQAAKYLFYNIGFGALVYLLGAFNLFAPDRDFFFHVGQLGKSTLRLGPLGTTNVLKAGGVSTCAAPSVSPALYRRGLHYRTGTRGAQLFRQRARLGPADSPAHLFPRPPIAGLLAAGRRHRRKLAGPRQRRLALHHSPIAVGGMMVGTCYTLFRMRKNLIAGLGKAFAELRGASAEPESAAAPSAI